MKKGKSNFFLIAPFALWGCISVWTSNLVRLTDKSAVPYAWASLFFSYGQTVFVCKFNSKRRRIKPK